MVQVRAEEVAVPCCLGQPQAEQAHRHLLARVAAEHMTVEGNVEGETRVLGIKFDLTPKHSSKDLMEKGVGTLLGNPTLSPTSNAWTLTGNHRSGSTRAIQHH